MTASVRAVVTCDDCRATIAYTAPSAKLSDVLDIAQREYGWAFSGRTHRCLGCRKYPPPFHAYAAAPPVGAYTGTMYRRCATCGGHDDELDLFHVVHREERIRANAAKLAAARVVEWGRSKA